MITTGTNIKKYRKKAGLTQKELAQKCGMAEITIRQYEASKREPRHSQLEKIAQVLNVDVIKLLVSETYPMEMRHRSDFDLGTLRGIVSDDFGLDLMTEEDKTNLLNKIDETLNTGWMIEDVEKYQDYFEENVIKLSHEVFDTIWKAFDDENVVEIVSLIRCYAGLDDDTRFLLNEVAHKFFGNEGCRRDKDEDWGDYPLYLNSPKIK